MTKRAAKKKSPELPTGYRINVDEWRAKGEQYGGGSIMNAKFMCVSCRNIQTPQQFKDRGAVPELAAVQCVGRLDMTAAHAWGKGQPCDWTLGGLFGGFGHENIVVLPDGAERKAFPFADEVNR